MIGQSVRRVGAAPREGVGAAFFFAVGHMQISDNPQIQAAYEDMCAAGQSPRLAEMLALRQPPMDKADRGFMAGLAPRPAEENRQLAKMAEKRGVDVTGATYLRSLARYPGDPDAFIRGRDDVKRVLEKRGASATGAVECDYRPSVQELQQKHVDVGVAASTLEDETVMHERRTKVKLRGRDRVDFKQRLYNLRKPSGCKTPFTPAMHDLPAVKSKRRKAKVK